MTETFTITDPNGDHRAEGLAAVEVSDTIRPWFPEAPVEVAAAVERLGETLAVGSPEAYGLAEYLGLRVESDGPA